ncbi:MAG TPA: tetratricopeptide repeat protein [Thiothrix sp.]|nr:tetratricopeptide repeat protein [Thiothrix sp.]
MTTLMSAYFQYSLRCCLLSLLLFSSLITAVNACDQQKADALVLQTFDMTLKNNPSRQQDLLQNALRHCANHPEALNNLGVLSENQGNLSQALHYYQQALAAKPDFAYAWLGLGDVYQKQGQLPRALEAYLNACEQDNDAKQAVVKLLKKQRYRMIEQGQVLDKESLLALYDPVRHQAILTKTKRCGFKARLAVKPSAVFRNFQFATGASILPSSAVAQLKEIAAALQSLKQAVQIDGHTDRRLFRGKSQRESDRLNRRLSQERANTIKQALIEQGIDENRLHSRGFGADQPLVQHDSEEAYAQNRRVEIKLR